MSKKLLVALLLCATVKAIAQNSGPFHQLDFSACETGHLLNLAPRATLPVNPDTLKILTQNESAHWLHIMHQTAINSSPIIPSWENIQQKESRHISEGIVTITLAHFHYNYIRPDALINGDITFADSVFQMTPGADIYETGLFMAAHLSQDYWPEQSVKFMLEEELLFTDIEGGPMTIEWDPGDGQGWRPLIPNAIKEIEYSDNSNHTLLFRITDDEQGSKITGCILKSGGCSSNYPMPVAPPWSSSNTGSYPFGISCQPNGIQVSGNAYYLPSGDFDKPFIFVEGIDFTPLQSAMQNGDFGWCQFTSGYESLDYPYSMISLMPKFLDSLRVRGYDIILVDFANGALSLNDNASLLIELIHLVNSFKTGDHPNIIAGASMGGQVCRYALKHMEDLGQEHCCRLWVSFDSPNTGAYVPIALQQVLDVLSDEPLVSYAINNKLLSPAAQQMLLLQHFQSAGYIPGGTDDFQNWYATVGYPSDCRKIAVTNGSLTGAYQKDQDGNTNSHYDHLLSYNCEALICSPGPEARFFMTPSCGDPWYSDNNGNQSNSASSVSAQVVLSEVNYQNVTNGGIIAGIFVGAIGGAAAALCTPDQQITTYSVPASLPNYDYAPGGYSNSLVEIIEGVNDEGTLTGSGCPAISDDNANLFHCFIPTASALGITGVGLYDNLNNLININPEICPFDAFFGPLSYNQPHTHLSWDNMRFLLDEITGGENAIGNPLIPDNLIGQTFNYGKAGYHELAAVNVSGNARICINQHLPFRYGTAGEPYPADNSHFEVSTAAVCSYPSTQILNGGKLEIGDPLYAHTATLHIRKNGTLHIGNGGSLLIHQGSHLKIHQGGRLILEQGSILNLNNGMIELLEGGTLEYNGGSITIQGSSAQFIIDDGAIQIASNQICEFNVNGNGSAIIVRSNQNPAVTMESGSTLTILGTTMDHDALIIEQGKHLSIQAPSTSFLRLFNCGAYMAEESVLQTSSQWDAESVHLHSAVDCADKPSIMLSGNISKFIKSNVDDIVIRPNASRLIARSCDMFRSEIRIYEGSYNINECNFSDSYIRSDELTYTSVVMNSNFNTCEENFIRDMSLTELLIDGSSFINCETYAVKKSGGMLSLRCNTFQSVMGIEANYGSINMTSLLGAGYNTFDDCHTCLKFEDINELLLQKGFNDFSGYNNQCMMGTINQNCAENCSIAIDAHYNKWHYVNTSLLGDTKIPCDPPVQQDFSVSTSAASPCGGYEAGGCEVIFLDANPICETRCRQRKVVKSMLTENQPFQLKNDIMNPISFEGIEYTADELWAYCTDSLMNDTLDLIEESNECLFALFNAIDTSYNDSVQLDFHNRIRLMMKRNIEFQLTQYDDPFMANENLTHNYIEVMNAMTDTILNSDTYKDQFYRELDKAQFFLSIGRSHSAIDVLDNMDNCLLDSVETDILSIWQARAEEIANYEYSIDSSSWAIIQEPILTDSATPQPSQTSSNYFFGCYIMSHDDYSFVSCGDDPEYRNMTIDEGNIFPNPADDRFFVATPNSRGKIHLNIFDMSGRLCLSIASSLKENSMAEINEGDNLPEGIYIVEYSTDEAKFKQLLQIVH